MAIDQGLGGPSGGPPSGGDRGGPGGRRPGGRGRGRYTPRRKVCQFCVDKVDAIDYKDISRLRRYVSERGKIEPRRKTGTCAKHQRRLSTAIKRARQVALLPFAPTHIQEMGGWFQPPPFNPPPHPAAPMNAPASESAQSSSAESDGASAAPVELGEAELAPATALETSPPPAEVVATVPTEAEIGAEESEAAPLAAEPAEAPAGE